MNKILISAIVITACLGLCSCNNQNGKTQEKHVETNIFDAAEQTDADTDKPQEQSKVQNGEKDKIKELSDAAIEKMSKLPEYPEGYPSLEAVTAQYKAADASVGWIVGTQKIETDSADTLELNGLTYQRVKPGCVGAELIYNIETLEAYLSTLMHPEDARDYIIDIDSSFETPKFVESESGALYALPYSYPVEGYGEEETYSLSDNGDGSYTFTVSYTVLNEDGSVKNEKSHSFRYVNVDGRWVFENFRVIKQ